jgi:hypothetical protein
VNDERRRHSFGRVTAEMQDAVDRLAAAARHDAATRSPESKELLHRAVDAARDVGVGWTRIGDTLGIARGNAYQRYRKRRGADDAPSECRNG